MARPAQGQNPRAMPTTEPRLILLAPMEGVLDHSLRDVLTRVGGIDRCVSEFIRVLSLIHISEPTRPY